MRKLTSRSLIWNTKLYLLLSCEFLLKISCTLPGERMTVLVWAAATLSLTGQQHWAELLAHVPSRNGTTFQNSKFLWEVEIMVGKGSKPDWERECLVRSHVPSWCLMHLVTPQFMRRSLLRCVHLARLNCRCGQVWVMQIWATVCCFQFVSVSVCFLFANDTPQQKGHYKNLKGLYGSWFWRWKVKGLHLAMVSLWQNTKAGRLSHTKRQGV